MPDPTATTARAYEADAASWHALHLDEDRTLSRRESYDRFVAQLPANSLVLDLGCGSGLDAPDLAARDLRLVGLDLSGNLLQIARSQPALDGRLALGDLRELPVASEAFDGVWLDGSLHHIPKSDLAGALAEIRRILRAGGSCFASVELGNTEGFLAQQDGIEGNRWFAAYQPDEIAQHFEHAGLTVVDQIVATYAGGGFIAVVGQRTNDAVSSPPSRPRP